MTKETTTFWSINDENGKLGPEIVQLYDFLGERGFRKRTLVGKESTEVELYQQSSFFIQKTSTPQKINEVTGYLEKEYKQMTTRTIDYPRKGPVTYTYEPREILEKIVKYGWGKIFSENNWNHLPELDVKMMRHTREKAYFYFRNGYVEITAKGSKLHKYDTLSGSYIFRDYLVNRDISVIDVDSDVERKFGSKGVDFLDFLAKVSGIVDNDITADQVEKFKYLRRLIGFLLHDYKQQGLTDFCVILCDDNTGGSGKGLIIQALEQLTSVAKLDCRKDVGIYDPDDLTERTRIKVYNDVQPSFNFGNAYVEITDGGTIRHMYGSPRAVPYKDTWKDLITSNYIIRGNNGPDQRRQRVFSMNAFFDQNNTVQDYYNQSFFSEDWTPKDWNFFYNLMFQCVQEWLAADYHVRYTDKEYQERKLESEYPMEFREYVDGLGRGMYHKTGDLYWGFKEHHKYKNSPFVRKLTATFFGNMLKKYLDEMKVHHHKNPNRTEIWIEK